MKTSNIYGSDDINKKISELKKQKENLIIQRDEISKKIKALDLEINKWDNISPNQYKMF
jgi:hypothetical protein